MKVTGIEIIFEECGWAYDAENLCWRLANFKVSRANLHKALERGQGAMLREQIIEKLNPSASDPNIGATIERLRVKNKK